MTDIKELRKKRGSYKGRITMFGNYLTSLNVSELTSCQAAELQLRSDRLQTMYDEFNEIQLQLECLSDSVDTEFSERSAIESQYYSFLARSQEMLNIFSKSQRNGEKSNCSSSRRRQLVKLPTIQLPKFSGSYDKWLEFRDSFSSLIHDNEDIDEINKFHYLRLSLEGTAAVVINAVDFSAQNYNTAWKLLCERFNNKRLLVHNHVSSLFNLDCISKESSISLKRIIDQVNNNIRALSALGEPVNSWDTLLIYIISQKLDIKTFREWETEKGKFDVNKPISFEAFIQFIRNRADLLETLEISRHSAVNSTVNNNHNQRNKLKAMVAQSETTQSQHCPKCNNDHNLNVCPQFLALSVNERMALIPKYKICYNCFRQGHYPNTCKRPGCKICKRKHHTLIHNNDFKHKSIVVKSGDSATSNDKIELCTKSSDNVSASVALSATMPAQAHRTGLGDVLLSTALVKCYDINNKEHLARALLDSGSSSCLMTEKLFSKLNISYFKTRKSIQGINNSISPVEKMCYVQIESLCTQYSNKLLCFVLPTITDNVPATQVQLDIPSNIHLADPYFHSPASIDLIIGADVFWTLLGADRIVLGDNKPILYETRLGWLVSGPINGGYVGTPQSSLIKCNFADTSDHSSSQFHEVDDIQNQLTRFWQLEEVCHESSTYSSEEKLCEEHFIKNTLRLPDGRFSVRIPLKESADQLGDSFDRAKRCFLSIERRNQKVPLIDKMYKEFMSEYISLGHMSECQTDANKRAYFVPHHGVLRESSSTTKLRVVFNASALTTSGISLNKIQMIGPTVQDDLIAILLRFRLYKYVLSADVEKMYRQISIHPSDRHLQQIVWREDSSISLKTYSLNTVTYGTASAPYLATRCLKQVGLECLDHKVSEAIIHDFYVDDLLTGADLLEDAHHLRYKITEALSFACMHLRKWKSNESSLISEKTDQCSLEFDKDNVINKTLGLSWQTLTDELCFPINVPEKIEYSKRNMLAVIARIFDPLGLLAPCVIRLKMLLQKLWLDGIKWDDQLTPEVAASWSNLTQTLPALNDVRIPRRVVCNLYEQLDFHIFTDASERAYGACLYIRSVNDQGDVSVYLLTAKSRVTPIKPCTIPRLELCAAVLGARLYKKVAHSLRTQFSPKVYFWTDSMIVLGWLKMLPIKLNTFVRNRVAEILENTSSGTWRHVSTHENPADLISRGVEATAIQSHKLWWYGPSFLKQDSNTWPCVPVGSSALPELKPVSFHLVHADVSEKGLIEFERFSQFKRLQRCVCYVLRFIKACTRTSNEVSKYSVNKSNFSQDELQQALNLIIIQTQRESFTEYNLLQNSKKLPNKSSLLKFNVFLDDNKIMRVGGRLHNSEYAFEKKHPILIQSTHHFVKLLFRYEHLRLMHAGPQLLLATIRETYWPLGGRNLARLCYRQCVRCKRLKGQTITPQMGNLPSGRLSPADFPFQTVGVDYAGPISSVSRQGRGCKLVKVYIVIFVCFTTKAIHLELVGDLTSSNYLQALRRFMSRRGKPLDIYSDNGTSFVGAFNEISNFLKGNCNSIADSAAHEGVNFHFIPAYAPHFGGLWEAGVKSTKFHLVRVLGNCNLTYEELNSLLIQVEGILNSRPLTPLSSNPEDLLPLTPGHFLIGKPITALPSKDLREHSTHHLSRHQRIEQLRQHFWTRWSKEYISELQLRVKWRNNQTDLKLNSLVVIKDDNLPPLRWKLGRIVALYPGADNISRVADIKTASGVVKRAFSKICLLLEE